MALSESRHVVTPEVLGQEPSPLVIRTRSESGVRWEAHFRFTAAEEGPYATSQLTRLVPRSRKDHPEKGGMLEEFDVRVARTSEGVGAAVHLIRERVNSWPIHWMSVGATEIRGRSNMTLVGVQDGEIDGLMEEISRQVKQHSK